LRRVGKEAAARRVVVRKDQSGGWCGWVGHERKPAAGMVLWKKEPRGTIQRRPPGVSMKRGMRTIPMVATVAAAARAAVRRMGRRRPMRRIHGRRYGRAAARRARWSQRPTAAGRESHQFHEAWRMGAAVP
jgi:hypothetical protein